MRWVEPHRNQQGTNLAQKIGFDPAPLRRVALALGQQVNTMPCKFRHQHFIEQLVLACHDVVRTGRQDPENVGRFRLTGPLKGHCSKMRGRAHLKKFVEVGGDDAQEAQTLQQRHLRTGCQVEHPLIEGEDATVTVKKLDAQRIRIVHHISVFVAKRHEG